MIGLRYKNLIRKFSASYNKSYCYIYLARKATYFFSMLARSAKNPSRFFLILQIFNLFYRNLSVPTYTLEMISNTLFFCRSIEWALPNGLWNFFKRHRVLINIMNYWWYNTWYFIECLRIKLFRLLSKVN